MSDRLQTLIDSLTALKMNLAPLVAGTSTVRVSATITTASVKIISANPARLGLILYNNSANSVYICLGQAANSSNSLTFILPTFQHLVLPTSPIYTGDIYGIRNAGTGTVVSTELTA
jgi:hypothetical protein